MDRNFRGNIHHRKAIHNVLLAQVAMAVGDPKLFSSGMHYQAVVRDFQHNAIRRAEKSYARHTGSTSCYTPHQGAQECARRVKQMKHHQQKQQKLSSLAQLI